MNLHITSHYVKVSKITLLSNIKKRQDCYPTVNVIPVAGQITTRITRQLAEIPERSIMVGGLGIYIYIYTVYIFIHPSYDLRNVLGKKLGARISKVLISV